MAFDLQPGDRYYTTGAALPAIPLTFACALTAMRCAGRSQPNCPALAYPLLQHGLHRRLGQPEVAAQFAQAGAVPLLQKVTNLDQQHPQPPSLAQAVAGCARIGNVAPVLRPYMRRINTRTAATSGMPINQPSACGAEPDDRRAAW